jgi:DNA-binding LacI/PurR family transcriptional regulator
VSPQQLKPSIVPTVASALWEQVVAGHAGEILPGVRILAQTFGVSVPTICRALHELADRGFLECGGNRRRWRVTESAACADLQMDTPSILQRSATRPHRLLFLSSSRLEHEHTTGVELLASLMEQLATSDWEVVYRVERFADSKSPRRAWDEQLRFTQPDALVVLSGTPVIGEWAMERNVRTIFVGGDPGNSGVPLVSVGLATMLRNTFAHLLDMGHRKVLLPLLARQPNLAMMCRQAATAMGDRRHAITILESPYSTPDVLIGMLRTNWQPEPPDALIFLNWREFIAASGFLNELGIKIPRDVSVIILTRNAMMDWHAPPISHYDHPVSAMARTLAKWATGERAGRPLKARQEIPARWVPQGSVAARQDGGSQSRVK